MYPSSIKLFFIVLLSFCSTVGMAQQKKDSAVKKMEIRDSSVKAAKDTAQKKPRSLASKAALRAAVLPGWGQIYNKKYWKLPLVYGALSIPVVTFQYNTKWYKKTREAYQIKYYNDTSKIMDLPTDKIDPRLLPLSTASLRQYRNSFRQDVDYSVLAFLLMWGLQIVDATVDAHLRGFNISDDLSVKIKPQFMPGNSTGLSLIFTPRTDKPIKQFNGF